MNHFKHITILTIIVSIVILSVCEAQQKPEAMVDVSERFQIIIPDYAHVAPNESEGLSDHIEQQQAQMRHLLLGQLQRGGLSTGAKADVIRLLGSLHAYEAVDALIENINFLDDRPSAGPKTKMQKARGYVARGALISIGRSASNTIFRIIGSRPSGRGGFQPSQVEGFVEVLYQVEGEKWALLKLQDGINGATDPVVKAQFQKVIDKYQEVIAHMQ